MSAPTEKKVTFEAIPTSLSSKKQDVLLPQDVKTLDPTKLTALSPEVVRFAVSRH